VGDWITLDLGIGAVGGAGIAGAVAIFLDWRRRRDEDKSRFVEKRMHLYQLVINMLDMMVEDATRRAEYAPMYSRFEQGTQDEADVEAMGEWAHRLAANHERLTESRKAARDLMFFGTRASTEPLGRMIKAVEDMQNCSGDGQTDDLARHKDEYRRAASDYLAATRRELGIRD
jgi:hypothetical protein